MQLAFVSTSTNNEWNAQKAVWSRAFRPSTHCNLITLVLTICHVKLTQSTAFKQKRLDLRSLSPALPNLWLLLIFKAKTDLSDLQSTWLQFTYDEFSYKKYRNGNLLKKLLFILSNHHILFLALISERTILKSERRLGSKSHGRRYR